MANTLIIRINNQESGLVFECWLPERDVLVIPGATPTPEEALQLHDFLLNISKIVALVPGEQVLMTHVAIPNLSSSRMVKALQFALEDQLTEDPSQLHFAVGRRLANGELTVAVVSKDKMNLWHEGLRSLLGSQFVKVSALVPDMLALPREPETISILIDHHLAKLKLSDEMGYVIEKNELSLMLELILAKHAVTKGSLINFYQQDDAMYLSEQDQQRLGVHCQIHKLSPPLLNLLAPVVKSVQPINLLQREYVPTYGAVGFEKAIYISAILVGVWLALLTLTDLFGYYLLKRESNVLHENIKSVYQSVYPNATVPEYPKDVLQKELAKLRMSTQDSAFIRLVGSVSTVLLPMTAQGLVPEKAMYRDNRLSLELIANDAVILNQLKQTLEQIGLRVVMGSAERSTSGSIKTRFTIEEMS